MGAIDVYTSYVAAGAGALVGFGLVSLVRTDQPRIRQALNLYRWAFACLGTLAGLPLMPDAARASYLQLGIGFVGMGVALLAWAFRQLNGRRTSPVAGTVLTLITGAVLWAGAWAGDRHFVLTIGWVFTVLSVGLAVEQGWLILRSPRVSGAEMSLLGVAAGFALNWVVVLNHALTVPGPYPAHWLHADRKSVV